MYRESHSWLLWTLKPEVLSCTETTATLTPTNAVVSVRWRVDSCQPRWIADVFQFKECWNARSYERLLITSWRFQPPWYHILQILLSAIDGNRLVFVCRRKSLYCYDWHFIIDGILMPNASIVLILPSHTLPTSDVAWNSSSLLS